MMNYHFDNHLLMVIVSRFLVTTKDGLCSDRILYYFLYAMSQVIWQLVKYVLGIEVFKLEM